MRFPRTLYTLSAGVLLGFLLAVTHGVWAEREADRSARVPLEDLQTFTEVFSRLKRDYVEDVSDEELLQNAIRGMVSNLDPHSSYLDADEYGRLREGTEGEFGGLGIEVGLENGFIEVIAPIDDTPAKRAGIQAGDMITRLDGQSVKGMSLQEAVDAMRGEPGTEITLTVIREGAERPLEINIERAVIKVESVKSRLLEPGFGYLRISQFQNRTGEQALPAVHRLKGEAARELRGLVLDLRNNPGGLLDAAVAIADAFLDDGRIVYTEGRVERAEMSFDATPGDVLGGAPVVVLINGGSASASEIVAGALQDHRRAVIMGRPSFGKGSVQSILPLPEGAALKLTTARYYTPSGRSIQAEGIEPDIEVENVRVTRAEGADAAPDLLRESDLNRHLTNGDGTLPEEIGEGAPEGHDSDGESLASEDYMLSEALNLLKGLTIMDRRDAE